ncbi:MAG: PAS domain S-box protein [Burkholderiales bacterium]
MVNIKILMVMDSQFNADLISRVLRNAGLNFDSLRVYDEAGMRACLRVEMPSPDVILSDDVLLHFDCLSALAVAHEMCPESPAIFISGGYGDELALECIKGGAYDFVLMSNLPRLPRAVERVIGEARERADRERARRSVAERDRFFARLIEQSSEYVVATDLNGVVLSWNLAAEVLYGFSGSEAEGKELRELHLANLKTFEYRQVLRAIRDGKSYIVQEIRRGKNGSVLRVVSSRSPLRDEAGYPIGQIDIGHEISANFVTAERSA